MPTVLKIFKNEVPTEGLARIAGGLLPLSGGATLAYTPVTKVSGQFDNRITTQTLIDHFRNDVKLCLKVRRKIENEKSDVPTCFGLLGINLKEHTTDLYFELKTTFE